MKKRNTKNNEKEIMLMHSIAIVCEFMSLCDGVCVCVTHTHKSPDCVVTLSRIEKYAYTAFYVRSFSNEFLSMPRVVVYHARVLSIHSKHDCRLLLDNFTDTTRLNHQVSSKYQINASMASSQPGVQVS